MKKTKRELRRDYVDSTHFHVGIELELKAPCENNSHDDAACIDSQTEYFSRMSATEILRDHFDLTRSAAENVGGYFNREGWVSYMMQDWECEGGCNYECSNGQETRDEIRRALERLTGNTSFKVVEDGSIETGDDFADAEVCWNYFASKETLSDNKKILDYLKERDCEFDTTCGLHINLNNYLHVPIAEIPTEKLSFLFKFVAPSRAKSSYCNVMAVSNKHKYSMIYHQKDRLEFRFFSPTLEASKLNAYVTLANTVYRRLAGRDAKLPRKARTFFLDKLQTVNGYSQEETLLALQMVDRIQPILSYVDKPEESLKPVPAAIQSYFDWMARHQHPVVHVVVDECPEEMVF